MESLSSFVNGKIASDTTAKRKYEQLGRAPCDLEKDKGGSRRKVYREKMALKLLRYTTLTLAKILLLMNL